MPSPPEWPVRELQVWPHDSCRAPLAPQGDEPLWFDREPIHQGLVDSILKSLFAFGIGAKECPASGIWGMYLVVGAIVGQETGIFLNPPPGIFGFNIHCSLWEELWPILGREELRGDRIFRRVILKSFFPHLKRGSPDRPFYQSMVEGFWKDCVEEGQYPITHLRTRVLMAGEELFARLPRPTAEAVRDVANQMGPMLAMLNAMIRRTSVLS